MKNKISIHEAGHAVIAFELGLPFRYAKLDTSEVSLNLVDFPKGNWGPEIATEDIQKLALHQLAGGVSELLILGCPSVGDGNDRLQAEKTVCALELRLGEPKDLIFERLTDRCRLLVEAHRGKILAAAQKLEMQGVLYPNDLRSLSDTLSAG